MRGELEEKVNKYVENQLRDYIPSDVRAPKVIHDTILGSNLFKPHEIAVLDLPIIQRLRRIKQVDLVPLVFPSGNHNRFEHTLGVTVIAEQLASAVYRRIDEGKKEGIKKYKKIKFERDYVLDNVRMAAIMHDCGHGPFSHMSEQVYCQFEDIIEAKRNNKILSGASPHEILSYLIVTSDAFKEFFYNKIAKKYEINIDLDLVGEMIVGFVNSGDRAFLIEMINGAFDADKIDYIQRDSHFTGIKMVLDTHRLFHTVDIISDDTDKIRLSVDLSGVATLEQIIFNKMMLFSTVYHHHKVRAAESLFKSVFEEVKTNNIKLYDMEFSSSADFLYLTDEDIFSLARNNQFLQISKLVNDLSKRNLPKRAMVISAKTIEKTNLDKLQKITSFCKEPLNIIAVKKAIAERAQELGSDITEHDIWIDIPDAPSFKEGVKWPIKSEGEEKEYVRLRDLFPVDDWVRAFSENKWKGYIFTRTQYREVVHKAARYVFEEVFDAKFNDFSRYLCKMDS